MFLSIIIPVFNVENYLDQCLNSVLSCNLQETEIILVTGASQDRSNDLCEEYQKKYSFITVLQQDATGLSDARNCGMKIAKGEYIVFIDSDDYIRPQHFNRLLTEIEKNDVLETQVFVSDFDRVADSGRIVKEICQIRETEHPIFQYEYMQEFLNQKECFWNVWRFVYRKDFLFQNRLIFKKDFLSEDIDYTVKVLLKASKIAFFHNPYYCYRVGRTDSLMGVVSSKRVHDTIVIIEDSVKLIQNSEDFPYKTQMTQKLLFEFILNLATIHEVPKKDKQKIKDLFHKSKYILGYNPDKTTKLIDMAIRVTGISFVSFGLVILKKMKRAIKRIKSGL